MVLNVVEINEDSMLAVCGSGMLMPDTGSEFFHPGSRVIKIPDPGSGSAVFVTTKKLFLSSQKNDPGFPIPNPARIQKSKKHRIIDF
jgi:hypothetical protein